jgi:hypothetical protein
VDTVPDFPRWGRSGSEAGHSPPCIVEIRNTWIYTSTALYVFMAWCLISWIHEQLYLLPYFNSHNNLWLKAKRPNTVHFAVLGHCLPVRFATFPSVFDSYCHAGCNIRECGASYRSVSPGGRKPSASSATQYSPHLLTHTCILAKVLVGKLFRDLWVLIGTASVV